MTVWDLHDLAGLGDLARDRGMTAGGASNWRRNHADFPRPIITFPVGPVYSRMQVWEWQETRWPRGRAGSGKVRYAAKPPYRDPQEWDLPDLASAGQLATRYGIHPAILSAAMARQRAPAPLVALSIGAIYSIRQVDAYWAARRTWPAARRRPVPPQRSGRAVPVKRGPRPKGRRFDYGDITTDLRRRILAGEWAPGQRLPSHERLAAEYDTSPRRMANPVRDLVAEGLLTTRRASGTYRTSKGASDGD